MLLSFSKSYNLGVTPGIGIRRHGKVLGTHNKGQLGIYSRVDRIRQPFQHNRTRLQPKEVRQPRAVTANDDVCTLEVSDLTEEARHEGVVGRLEEQNFVVLGGGERKLRGQAGHELIEETTVPPSFVLLVPDDDQYLFLSSSLLRRVRIISLNAVESFDVVSQRH